MADGWDKAAEQRSEAKRACPRCQSRGQPWLGSAPKCAFLTGVFSDDNWNCATLNALRELAEEKQARVYGDDESCGVVRCGDDLGGFVVLTWYKNRGRTSNGIHVGDSPVVLPLTLETAEATLAHHGAL